MLSWTKIDGSFKSGYTLSGFFYAFRLGVALMFSQWQAHIGDEHASIQYVGVLKDILRLDLRTCPSQLQSF
jgi:hypothetical protein